MTQKHYLAVNKRLKQGIYGRKEIRLPAEEADDEVLKKAYFAQVHEINKKKHWLICETKADAVGIAIERQKEMYIPHIKNKFIYELDCADEKLAYKILFRFMEENLDFGDKLELYTCLDGEEEQPRNEAWDTKILLEEGRFISGEAELSFKQDNHIESLSQKFRWHDRQYVVIRR
ncbi:hypothetical protein [Terribacillus aidingensis]|uniref:hypothetical protein n=1 Tax=Terribacillus aidingensis TaxID=586416 RepID=UPI000BE40E86|nr:hypothetical protein [Terribacillus aidingensis]